MEPPYIPAETEAQSDGQSDGHDDNGRMRVTIAEFRVWQAYQLLEDAEQRVCPSAELAALEAGYLHEMAT